MGRLPPSRRQLCPIAEDLDGQVVLKNLLGKTVDEAVLLLQENSTYYGDDYTWMGPEAFLYYVSALPRYLATPESDDDGDFAYFMIQTFRSRLRLDGLVIAAAIPAMREFCQRTVSDFVRLGFEPKYETRLARRVAEFEEEARQVVG